MKKHKVEIPEGYEVESVQTYDPYDNKGNRWKETTVKFKPNKKQLPKTWEEYKGTNLNMLETKPWEWEVVMPAKYIESVMALIRLIQLRDHYNEGWEPDLTKSDQGKWYIGVEENKIVCGYVNYTPKVLTFKTKELRDEFLSNFRDLIEAAKPLL